MLHLTHVGRADYRRKEGGNDLYRKDENGTCDDEGGEQATGETYHGIYMTSNDLRRFRFGASPETNRGHGRSKSIEEYL